MRLLFLLLSLSVSSLYAQKTDEDQVLAAFEGYRTAILNDRGVEAIEFLDRRNFDYYGVILDQVRTADSSEVADLSFMDRFMILRLRHQNSAERLEKFTDSTLIVYAIEEGMIGKDGVSNTRLGEVIITDDFATGEIIVRGEETPLNYHFYKSDDRWKLDLTSSFAFAQLAFQEAVTESGMEEGEFIFLVIELVTGEAVDETIIWRPREIEGVKKISKQ